MTRKQIKAMVSKSDLLSAENAKLKDKEVENSMRIDELTKEVERLNELLFADLQRKIREFKFNFPEFVEITLDDLHDKQRHKRND